MSDNAQSFFFFSSSEREDEFEEDIDNYDREFNFYDDGIDRFQNENPDDLDDDDDDDDLIEDDETLPLFDEREMDELDDYDDMED